MVSLRTRSRLVMAVFAVVLVVAAASAWSDWKLLGFVERASDGHAFERSEADSIDARQALMGRLELGARVLCAIAFLTWFHAAHKNLAAGGLEKLSYTPGWAIGGFFVPILSLFRPYQVMGEVARGSAYLANPAAARSWRAMSEGPAVGVWWLFFLLMQITGTIAARLPTTPSDASSFLAGSWLSLGSDVLAVPAALAAVHLVRRITDWQEHARVHSAEAVFD